jgi:hypothetical protein
MTDAQHSSLDIQEQIIRIDHMIIDMQRIMADRDRKRQETRLAWWPIFIAGMASAAALIGATIAFMKLFPNLPH